MEALDAIEHPNIPAEGARVSHFIESLNGNYNEWKRDLMNGIRQGRVEPPANVTAAYRLASSYIRIDGSTKAAGNSELVDNAFVTKATKTRIPRRRAVIARNQAEARRSPKTRLLTSVIHAVKLAIGLRIARVETRLRSSFRRAK